MQRKNLKLLRFFVPGVLIVLGWVVLEFILHGKLKYLPTSWSDLIDFTPVVFSAVFYRLTPLRTWFNSHFHAQVGNHIVSNLTQIAGVEERTNSIGWKDVQGFYWPIIDGDISLSAKAELIYENGLIWTSAADLRVVGVGYFLWSLPLIAFGENAQTIVAAIVFLVIVLISVWLSLVFTRKHLSLIDDQISIISHHYKDKVIKGLNELQV